MILFPDDLQALRGGRVHALHLQGVCLLAYVAGRLHGAAMWRLLPNQSVGYGITVFDGAAPAGAGKHTCAFYENAQDLGPIGAEESAALLQADRMEEISGLKETVRSFETGRRHDWHGREAAMRSRIAELEGAL